jgi:small subunit ribosomal protein S2
VFWGAFATAATRGGQQQQARSGRDLGAMDEPPAEAALSAEVETPAAQPGDVPAGEETAAA